MSKIMPQNSTHPMHALLARQILNDLFSTLEVLSIYWDQFSKTR